MTQLDASIVRHREDCLGAMVFPFLGKRGDDMAICGECGRTAVVKLAQPSVVTRWRCRIHLDEPVTWRGTGCRECARGDHAWASSES